MDCDRRLNPPPHYKPSHKRPNLPAQDTWSGLHPFPPSYSVNNHRATKATAPPAMAFPSTGNAPSKSFWAVHFRPIPLTGFSRFCLARTSSATSRDLLTPLGAKTCDQGHRSTRKGVLIVGRRHEGTFLLAGVAGRPGLAPGPAWVGARAGLSVGAGYTMDMAASHRACHVV